jgi:hypothetical protein
LKSYFFKSFLRFLLNFSLYVLSFFVVRPQVRTRVYLDLALPSIVWKQLVQQPVTEADVIAIDVLAFNLINQVRAMGIHVYIASVHAPGEPSSLTI